VLWLQETPVSDVAPLAGLKNLRAVKFSDTTQVSEEQVKKFQQALPKCYINWSSPELVTPPPFQPRGYDTATMPASVAR